MGILLWLLAKFIVHLEMHIKLLQEKDTNCKKTIKEAPLSDTPDQL